MAGRRSFNSSRKMFDEPEKSFRGQLYESTARRLQRQREDEARFASNMPITPFARNAAITFCISPFHLEKGMTNLGQQLYSPVYWHTGLVPSGPRKSPPYLQRLFPRWTPREMALNITPPLQI